MPPEQESQGQEEGTGEQEDQGLASPFLAKIPDTDKPYVEKYITDWDKGVQERFRSIHDEYKPYKELGDVDTLKQALEIANLLETSPQVVYDYLAKEFAQSEEQKQEPQKKLQGTEVPPELTQYLSPLEQQIQQQQQILEQLSQVVIARSQLDKEAQEDQELDSMLSDMKKKHGEFDEDFVLTRLYVHGDPEKAVKEFKEVVGKYSGNNNVRKAPPPLSGGGISPSGTQSVSQMSGKDVREMVANMLANSKE